MATVLLRVGTEGGDLALVELGQGHGFAVVTAESYALPDEVITASGETVYPTLEVALASCPYPWHRLHPLFVHTSAIAAVRAAWARRWSRERAVDPHRQIASERWARHLGPPSEASEQGARGTSA